MFWPELPPHSFSFHYHCPPTHIEVSPMWRIKTASLNDLCLSKLKCHPSLWARHHVRVLKVLSESHFIWKMICLIRQKRFHSTNTLSPISNSLLKLLHSFTETERKLQSYINYSGNLGLQKWPNRPHLHFFERDIKIISQ